MSELDTEDGSVPTELITQEVAPTDTGTTESGSESAPDTGVDQEKIDQDAVNKAIGKQHAKYREEQRKREASDAHAVGLQARLDAIEAAKPKPIVPQMPDQYDDDFEAKMQVYNTAVVNKANSDAQQATMASQQQAQQAATQQANVDRQNKAGEIYRNRATELGINQEQLQTMAQTVLNNGLREDIAEFILRDPDGPLIISHLAANPIEQDDLNSMDSMSAAVTISTVLRAKAAALKPKQSNAPDPVVPLSGNGVDPDMNKHPVLKGVKYS